MHINAQEPTALSRYLKSRQWLSEQETITGLEKPGEGNMNYTLRIITSQRSVIIKQARSYVEKYPSIPAPAERAVIEGRFYQKVQTSQTLSGSMPALLGMDEEHNILLLEDLGAASDYTFLYQPGQVLSAPEAGALVVFLSALHSQFLTDRPDPAFTNRAMRELNHEHIFRYPFLEENGFDLDTIQPGLQALSVPFKQNTRLREAARELGAIYLGNRSASAPLTLLHGDYYPGSWLRTKDGLKIIDPEFCFYGPAEFDLGVMLAHLKMSRQPDDLHKAILAQYQRSDGFDETLLNRFTGVEILRRILGLAQLPLSLSLEQKQDLLTDAQQLLLT
ncbi:hypothetical protein GCM10023187_56290 [Nibrella viscosa]|uniref:Aminoglycoside phosphotransferase domain-containing protein n=1 Tax=Nibrella viscosa TaxID=1084524 RepID=A0ABP8L1Z4_9BACT